MKFKSMLIPTVLIPVGIFSACGQDGNPPPPAKPDNTDICVSHGIPMNPDGVRGPDSLCTDDQSINPVWVWWSIPNNVMMPALAQRLPANVGSIAPSGSSQLPNTQQTYGNASPKAAPAEPEEEPENQINQQEEEDEQAAQASEESEEESSASSAAEEESSESAAISSAASDDE